MNPTASERSASSRRQPNSARHSPWRWLPYTGAAALVVLLAIGLWPQPTPVETTPVTVGLLRTTVNEEGRTRIKHRYTLSAPVTGQLRRISLKAGDEIPAAGTVLAIMEPASPGLLDARSRATALARRDAAKANEERARAAHVYTVSELRRLQRLHTAQTATAQELEAAQWREASALKEYAAAEGSLRQAEAELEEYAVLKEASSASAPVPVEIRAPVCGRVLRVFEENARVVAAGTPLLEIGDPTDLEVLIEVLSRDGAAIESGALVEFDQWGGNEVLMGKVRMIEPSAFTKVSALGVEEQRVNVIADLVTPPQQRRNLGDQFRVDARIVVWDADRVLKAPTGALFRRGDGWGAFVVEEGRARLRDVDVGPSNGLEIQIKQGLKEHDEVILYPGDRVQHGRRVKRIKL
ncbi:MAG TPA: HlyD family efflux transporter periplasmic adaptor subunit [Candidatus Paceibacterota bacterium]|nr:HlyD family efflux transporter periplasmic adaptor subunit [Candidatus Paceibacterota bacterium]